MESADDILARQVAIAKAREDIKQLASKQPIAKPATIQPGKAIMTLAQLK